MLKEADVRRLLDAVPTGEITREDHGPDGQQALYIGRGPDMHGLNIVHLTEPAHQWPAVFDLFAASPEIARMYLESREENRRLRAAADAVMRNFGAGAVTVDIDAKSSRLIICVPSRAEPDAEVAAIAEAAEILAGFGVKIGSPSPRGA